MASSSSLTLFAARTAVTPRVTAVLRDWAALGLISPVLVVDTERLRGDDLRVPAVVVDAGGEHPVVLQETLASGSYHTVRLGVLSDVGVENGLVDTRGAQGVAEVIQDSLSHAHLVQVHLSFGSPGDDWAKGIQPLLGWQNLALSPEDAAAPERGISPLSDSATDPRWLLYVVGSLCSLFGLWKGQGEVVLDTIDTPHGEVATPVRVFTRLLEADELETALASRLLSFGNHYPAPRMDIGSATVADDELAAAQIMAEKLLAKHADVLPRARVVPPAPAAQPLGFRDALEGFFTFLGAALRNIPRSIADAMLRRVAIGSAGALQNMVFGGAESGYAVVVRGVRADGSAASWSEYESSLDSLMHRGNTPLEFLAPPQKPQLWRDFVAGALTLLDAGNRSADLGPIMIGTQRAVVSRTGLVVPSPRDTFRLPPDLAALLPNWKIEPVDDIDASRLYEELGRRRQEQPQLAQAIATERQRLKEWSSSNGESFAGRVGRRLGNAYRDTVREVDDLNKKLQSLISQPALPEDIGDAQDKLAGRLRILTIVVVALMVITGILMRTPAPESWESEMVLDLWPGIGVLVGLVVAWIITGTLMYLRGQQKLYHFINERRQATSELEVVQRHRAEALEDLRKVVRVYRQYLDWARALGAFVSAPLGHAQSPKEQAVVVGQGFPRAIKIGVAVADDDAIDKTANTWRSELFRAGWLTAPWQDFVADVPASVGSIQHLMQNDVEAILDQDPNPDGRGPVLTRWSRAVANHAETRTPPDNFLDRIRDLAQTSGDVREQLLARVRVRDPKSGELRELSRSDFLEGIAADASGPSFSFAKSLFSERATDVDVRLVARSKLTRHLKGLTSVLVLTQFGMPKSVDQYIGSSSGSGLVQHALPEWESGDGEIFV